MNASQNRRDFPFVPEWKENLEPAFGTVFVRHARNGDKEVGERFEDRCKREGLVECRLYLHGYPGRGE